MATLNTKNVLIKPIISEKANISELRGVYTFEVEKDSTKVDIANSVIKIYGVTPEKVRVMHYDGKKVRRGRWFGQRKNWKKAIVTLPKGKTIDIHAGV